MLSCSRVTLNGNNSRAAGGSSAGAAFTANVGNMSWTYYDSYKPKKGPIDPKIDPVDPLWVHKFGDKPKPERGCDTDIVPNKWEDVPVEGTWNLSYFDGWPPSEFFNENHEETAPWQNGPAGVYP